MVRWFSPASRVNPMRPNIDQQFNLPSISVSRSIMLLPLTIINTVFHFLLVITLLSQTNGFNTYQSKSNNYQYHHHDLTVDMEDPLGYEAIKGLHSKIDDDQNGSIDRKESSEFIVEDLQINDGVALREESLHDGDSLISVDEMWQAWKQSPVSRWTVLETLDWLNNHVKLPQYSSNFMDNHIDGSRLPRIASNPTFVTHVLKISDPLDRQKLIISAIEAVLFGVGNGKYFQDYHLITILVSVMFILWFVLNQRRNVQKRLDKVFQQMSALQESRSKLLEVQQELDQAKEGNKVLIDETENLSGILRTQVRKGLHEYNSLKERELSLMDAIDATRRRLVQAEQMLANAPHDHIQQQKAQLQRWLQITYEIENNNFSGEKTMLEAELIKAQHQHRSKRNRRASARKSSHGSAGYDDLTASRAKLTDLINRIEVAREKWMTSENLCGFAIRENPGLAKLRAQMYSLHNYPKLSSVALNQGQESDESSLEEDDFSLSPEPDVMRAPNFPKFNRSLSSYPYTTYHGSEFSSKKNSSTRSLNLPWVATAIDEHDQGKRALRKSTFIIEENSSESDPMEFRSAVSDKISGNHHEQLREKLDLSKSYNSSLFKKRLLRRSSSLQDILLRFRDPINHGR